MKRATIITMLAAIAGAAGWYALEQRSVPVSAAASGHSAQPDCADGGAGWGPSGAQGGKQWLSAVDDERDMRRVPLPAVDSSSPAWLSMAAAREHGDARTPPVQHDATPQEGPSAAQLADKQAYADYERGQHARLLASYVAAADAELPRLRTDLERGRAAGIPEAQLAKVEEKIRRIEQQRGLAASHTAAQRPGALPPS